MRIRSSSLSRTLRTRLKRTKNFFRTTKKKTKKNLTSFLVEGVACYFFSLGFHFVCALECFNFWVFGKTNLCRSHLECQAHSSNSVPWTENIMIFEWLEICTVQIAHRSMNPWFVDMKTSHPPGNEWLSAILAQKKTSNHVRLPIGFTMIAT